MSMQRVTSLAAAALFTAATYAADPSTSVSQPALPDAPECPAIDGAEGLLPVGAGLRAFIDPSTGRLREPTDEEMAAIAASSRFAQNDSSEGLVVERRKDGTKIVNLQGRFMHAVQVSRAPDGTLTTACDDRDPKDAPGAPTVLTPAEDR